MKMRYAFIVAALWLGAAHTFALTPTDLSGFGSLNYDEQSSAGKTIRFYKDLAYSTRDDLPTEGTGYTGSGSGKHRSGTYYDVFVDNAAYASSATRAKMPVFLFLHGGAWCQPYDKDVSCHELMRRVAAKGYFVVSMDYQLQENVIDGGATEPREKATFGHMLKDVDTMLDYLRVELPKIGVPTNKVVIGGESAGGHLALCYAFDQASPLPAMSEVDVQALTHPLPVACVTSVVGPADLSEGQMAAQMYSDQFAMYEAVFAMMDPAQMDEQTYQMYQMYMAAKGMKALMGWLTNTDMGQMDYDEAKAVIQKWAPLLQVNSNVCPAIFAYGCTDAEPNENSTDDLVPVSNFIGLTNRFASAHIPYYAKLYTSTSHGSVPGAGADWIADKLAAFKAANFDVAVSNVLLKASTDRENPIDYVEGDEIRFDFRLNGVELDGVEALPTEIRAKQPLHVIWTRKADDGVTVKGTNTISLAQGFSVSTSLGIPGIVKMTGTLVGSDYKVFTYIDPKDGKTVKNVTFVGGAGVSTEKMRLSAREPADFDQFWAEAKAKLATVPFPTDGSELTEVFPNTSNTNNYRYYAAKIPCYGPRPVTGWIIMPKKPTAGGIPVQANFEGYGCIKTAPSIPTGGVGQKVYFAVNAHGYDMIGQDDQYYQDFYKSLYQSGRSSYALEPSDYDNPTNTYFYYMAMRVMRAFEYLKSRKEWNGRDVIAVGGSQGGLQTMWAGGLVDGITKIQPSITWGCDIGCPFNGNGNPYPSRTWGIPCVPGAVYFDSALHARRVPRDCIAEITRLGMGDYTCPPRGVLLSYYNMRCKASAKLVQGSDHGYVPPSPNQVYTISKDVAADAFSSDEPGFDYTNRVVTVTSATSEAKLTLIATAPDGTTTRATATADENGEATFDVATEAGVAYTYAVELFGDTIATGGFFTGGWDAGGTWFSASGASGESVVSGGAWNETPGIENGKYSISGKSNFALAPTTSAASSDSFVLVCFDLDFDELYDGDALEGYANPDSYSSFVAATNVFAGTSSWMASGAGGWKVLYGDVSPEVGKMYSVRVEADFASNPPRMRYEVKEAAGAAYTPLYTDAARTARWIDCSLQGSVLSSVGFEGKGGVASLGGALGNANVAAADGVGYESFEAAVAAATNSLELLTNATWPSNPPVGTTAVDLGGYALRGATLDGDNKVVVQNGYANVPGGGKVNISLGDVSSLLGADASGMTPAQIAKALAEPAANGIPLWKNHVLGLDPTKADSQPKASIVMNGDKVELSLVGIDVNAASGATVTYKVYKFADLANAVEEQASEATAPGDTAEVTRDASETKMFYRLKIDVSGY